MALNEISIVLGLVDDGIEVACHGLLVERVDLRRLGRSAGG